MTGEDKKMDEEEDRAEKPEIYSLKRGEKGFTYNRRDFLVTAAAGGAAIGMIGVGIGKAIPDNDLSNGVVNEDLSVLLEVEALGMLIMPVSKMVEHTWKITNTGKIASPQATLCLSAVHDPGFQQALDVSRIAPGQSVEVPVSLTAPDQVGDYRYQWQLRLGDGNARVHEFVLKVTDAVLAESDHPYANDFDYTWTINNPDPSATASQIHFTQVEVEENYDFVYVRDGSGNVIQTLTGSYPSGGWTNAVPGQVVQVRLQTDGSVVDWGFQVDEISTTELFNKFYLPYIRKPVPTPTSYVVCSCNTVDLCVCNLVCVCEAVCSCDGYCSCNTVCSCDSYCTCNTVHYWYPN